MKAVQFHEHGDTSVLTYEETETPEIGDEDVLVRVKATSVNHIDAHMRRGVSTMHLDLPHIPGSDIVGTVERTGKEVEGWDEDDRVVAYPVLWCGECSYCLRGEQSMCDTFKLIGEHVDGAYAEYVRVPAKNLIELPEKVDYTEAAAAGLVYMTAWRMVSTKANLKPGDDVLITGASGGVGSAAVDIAKRIGANVYATAGSKEKEEFVRDRGADFVINYRENKIGDVIRDAGKVDVVIDSVGGDIWMDLLKSLRKGGKLVTCGATTSWNPNAGLNYVFYNQLDIMGSTMCSATEARDVLELVFEKELSPAVDRVLPLKKAETAHEIIEDGDRLGKIVLEIG